MMRYLKQESWVTTPTLGSSINERVELSSLPVGDFAITLDWLWRTNSFLKMKNPSDSISEACTEDNLCRFRRLIGLDQRVPCLTPNVSLTPATCDHVQDKTLNRMNEWIQCGGNRRQAVHFTLDPVVSYFWLSVLVCKRTSSFEPVVTTECLRLRHGTWIEDSENC